MNAFLNLSSSYASIIGFPCNQFAHQEPAANKTELMNGLYFVRPGDHFSPAFDIMEKGDVNGVNESSVYKYLKETCPLPDAAQFWPRESFWEPFKTHDIAWNFEKFLIDTDGTPVFRFLSKVEPFDILNITKILSDETVDRNNILQNENIKTELSNIENKYTDKSICAC